MTDLTRAHSRFLGLPVSARPRSDEAAQPPQHVTLSFQALAFFRQQLYTSSGYRGGPLFGFLSHGDLSMQYAAPAGYACGDPALRHQPLALDERYVLGWTDALGAVYPGKLDWIGNWLMYPDAQLAPLERDLQWLREGLETDLFNEERILMTVGWDGGLLGARVHGYDRSANRPFILPHDLTGE